MLEKLKACPKCSGKLIALQSDSEHKGQWQGACMRCGKVGAWAPNQEKAIEEWNKVSA